MANLASLALVIIAAASISAPAAAFTNYTVGAAAGWFFNSTTNTSSADFTKWAANTTFNLGDFLIFNTSSNQTVIQTYNETTYQSCNTDEASGNDTYEFSGGNNEFGQALVIAVPLTIEGPNYYFSDADDGIQCKQGMRFEIVVKHGTGLPPSLNQPPPPPSFQSPPPTEADQSPPVNVPGTSQGNGSGGANVRAVVTVIMFYWGIFGFLA